MMGIMHKIQRMLNFEGCKNPQFIGDAIGKVGTTGFLLGLVGGIHIGTCLTCIMMLILQPLNESVYLYVVMILHWSIYMSLLCLFHFGEFFITAVHQPKVLSYSSFVVNHGTNYTIAALASWFEYWVESWLFGYHKHVFGLIFIGTVLVIFGQVIRATAMWTCGSNFAHIIMEERHPDHQLVTEGIYSVLRHPSYFGWFWWSLGTQVLLCNPVCAVAYAAASWHFFNDRIPYEEALLVKFYGDKYRDYAASTVIGIPCIGASPTLTNKGQR